MTDQSIRNCEDRKRQKEEQEEKEEAKKKFIDEWVGFNKGVISKVKMSEILEGFKIYWNKQKEEEEQQ